MKKVLGLLLAVCMLISMLPTVSFAANVSDWAQADVAEAIDKNLIPPEMVNDDFTENITRAEFAAIAVQLYEQMSGVDLSVREYYVDYVRPLTTDYTKHLYRKYIEDAYYGDIVAGVSGNETTDHEFMPDAPITREQLATMLNRVVKKYMFADWQLSGDDKFPLNYAGAVEFADGESISEYAEEAVYFMSKHGIVYGMDEQSFAPLAQATKEQAILLALRIFNAKENWDALKANGAPATYAQQYTDYVVANAEAFERGVALYDFNEDGTPELFAVEVTAEGWFLNRHDPVNGVANPEDRFMVASRDVDLVRPVTFYEDPSRFQGMYRDKNTGVKTYISYDITYDYFRAYSYTADGFNVIDYSSSDWAGLDKIMQNYIYLEETIRFSVMLHGGHTADTLEQTMPGVIAQYEHGQLASRYEKRDNTEFDCYIHSVDLDKGEIVLVPAEKMTYEAYTAAMNADRWYTLNGCEYIIHQGPDYAPEGYACLYDIPNPDYWFEIPTAEYPETLIAGYFEHTPVKVKISASMTVNLPDFGKQDSNYKTVLTAGEFFTNYRQNHFVNCDHAVIENGELVRLDVYYHP